MSTFKPAVLFVHGAWHRPDPHYRKLQESLTSAGFDVVAPEMPSANRTRPPTATFEDDVSLIRDEAAKLVEEGRIVLVLTHSYGGIVTTSAITQDLALTTRRQKSQAGGVVSIVYLCAFLPTVGGSVDNLWNGSGAVLHFDVLEDGVAFPSNPIDAFYGGVEPKLAQYCADNLGVQPGVTFITGATAEAWRFLPMTYIHCTQDGAIPYVLQQKMVAAVRASDAAAVRVETLEASHSPFLNEKVDELVGMVETAWNSNAATYKYPAVKSAQ